MNAKHKRRLYVLIPVIVVVAIFSIAAIRFFISRNEVDQEITAVPVVVGSPVRRSVEETLRYPGTLASSETVTVVPKIAGRIESIYVREGEAVKRGNLLIELEAEAAQLQAEQALSAWNAADAQLRKAERGVREAELENAQADLRQAEADFTVAENNFERSKRLYEAGTIAKAAYEDAENELGSARTSLENARRSVKMMEEGASSEELDMARANAEAAKAAYELAKLQLDNATVTSPVSGLVARIFVDVGNTVGAGTALLAIVQEDPIEACIRIPEKYYSRFAEASAAIPVRVFPIAYPDRPPFEGKVTSVAPVIDPASRTFEVCADIGNSRRLLKPGMYVNTEIVIGNRADLLMVPNSAVVIRDDQHVMYIVVNSESTTAVEVPVEKGIAAEGFTAVSGAVTEDDLVIILGNAFLEDGQRVEVVEQR